MFVNLQQANYESLLDSYYQNTTAHQAAEHLGSLIQDKKGQELAILLRDYREEAITSSREINLRAATDRLMKCCSVMEIASLARFIPDLRQTKFGLEMHAILENEYVRRYYEEFYPEKLPLLFRFRLAGKNLASENIEASNINGTIIAFLDLDRRFMETLDDSYLLRMLDSFTIDGYRFSDIIDLINRPSEFIHYLLMEPKERETLSHAVNELSLFMQFCFDLKCLLSRSSSYPI